LVRDGYLQHQEVKEIDKANSLLNLYRFDLSNAMDKFANDNFKVSPLLP